MWYVLYGIGSWLVVSALIVGVAGIRAGRRRAAVAVGRPRWMDSLDAPLALWTNRPAPIVAPRSPKLARGTR